MMWFNEGMFEFFNDFIFFRGGNTFRISGAKYLVVQDKVDNGLSLALQTPAWGSLLCSVLLI
jgi:hypothetical protein